MSCQVLLDGEVVTFSGNIPEKIIDLLLFFDAYLADKQKTLTKVLLDDIALQEKHFEEESSCFLRIQMFSGEKTNYLKELFDVLNESVSHFFEILSFDLEKILQTSQALLKALKDVLIVLEREHFLLFTLQIQLYSQWMQTFLESLECKDVGTLMDLVEYTLKPLLQETYGQSYGKE